MAYQTLAFYSQGHIEVKIETDILDIETDCRYR